MAGGKLPAPQRRHRSRRRASRGRTGPVLARRRHGSPRSERRVHGGGNPRWRLVRARPTSQRPGGTGRLVRQRNVFAKECARSPRPPCIVTSGLSPPPPDCLRQQGGQRSPPPSGTAAPCWTSSSTWSRRVQWARGPENTATEKWTASPRTGDVRCARATCVGRSWTFPASARTLSFTSRRASLWICPAAECRTCSRVAAREWFCPAGPSPP